VPNPVAPDWLAVPIDQRRVQMAATAERLFGDLERPIVRIALPDAPGARILLSRLANDWGELGLTVEAAKPDEPADFRLIDAVAPSTSPAWYLRNFRCGEVAVCEPEADELLEGARAATVGAQRNAMLAQAAQRMDEEQLFIPIAAPIRWSLVSDRVQGFATNRFARHTLTSLGRRLDRERAD
jgi:oligopeptide transport system substrate-binding protein